VFFGFTHCPDVCPTTLAELAQVAKELGEDAEKHAGAVRHRRSRSATRRSCCARYVPSFNPLFSGSTGTEATAAAAKEFKIYHRSSPRRRWKLHDRSLRRHLHSRSAGAPAALRPVRRGRARAAARHPHAARRVKGVSPVACRGSWDASRRRNKKPGRAMLLGSGNHALHLGQRFRLDLPDALGGDAEFAGEIVQRRGLLLVRASALR
jgi:hypothetical protein